MSIIGLLIILFYAIILAVFVTIVAMFLIYWERKLAADFQQRLGPMRVGFHGALQLIADAIKLLAKEDITPTNVDKIPFFLAPIVAFVAAFAVYLVVPFSENLVVRDLNIGILYILAVTSLTVVSILMAGWSSNSKWTLLGGLRSANQIISYEVPVILSLIGVLMLAGTLSTKLIVEAQKYLWFILLQPLGFLIYITAAVAETNRAPFDLPEAESELVAGYSTEYSGMKFGMLFFAEFINMFTVAAICTILFLGGWYGPFLPGFIWFILKTLFIVFVIMWLKWTFPRVRLDQLMNFGWKVLTPLAFLNIFVTGLIILAFSG